MVDVLLTHSYHLYYDPKQVRKMQPYPPLGTLYAAALLRQHGFSVALFDTMLEDPELGFRAALARHRPRVVAIYEDNFNFLSKMCLTRMREVAFGMLEEARSYRALVVANGSDASDHVEEYLRSGFDYVLLREGERTLLELVQGLAAGGSDRFRASLLLTKEQATKGLAFWDQQTSRIVYTPMRPPLRDLDNMPFPARDLIDLDHYRDLWRSAHGYFSMNAVASRGCPFRCNWCAKPIYGDLFHVRSADGVAEEMRELKESFGVEHIWFADDIFGLKPRWPGELADAVEHRRATLPFKVQSRVNLMTAKAASALGRAGCTEVWIGVESGSQRILDAMDKGTRVDEVPVARENLRRHGIRACFFLQFGYPGETWDDIQETIRLVRRTRPDDIGVSVSYPLPGTKFYDRVQQELGAKRNWVDSDDLAMMFKGTYTEQFYRVLRDALHAEIDTWSGAEIEDIGAVCGALDPRDGRSSRVEELWKIVWEMEKTGKNVKPTLASCVSIP